MNITLIVCKGCGVLLDADRLGFVDENHMHKDDGTIDESVAVWSNEGWGEHVPFVTCPVCQAKILKEG